MISTLSDIYTLLYLRIQEFNQIQLKKCNHHNHTIHVFNAIIHNHKEIEISGFIVTNDTLLYRHTVSMQVEITIPVLVPQAGEGTCVTVEGQEADLVLK